MENKNNIGKHTFTVPEGYFEKLSSEILSATVERRPIKQQHKGHVLGLFGRFIGYAAAVALLFIVAKHTFMAESNGNTAWTEGSNAQDEYIDNVLNSYAIDDYTFYCYLTDSDFE